MRRTLFYIPHEIFGLPVFGVGWVLIGWLIVSGWMLFRSVRSRGWDGEAWGQIPLTLIVAAAVVMLVPQIEEPISEPILIFPPVAAESGLPIRGYGVMLLIAVVSGVATAAWRAKRAGLDPNVVFNLAFSFVVCGIVGARLFFIVQYWDTLKADTLGATLGNLLSVDKGGLVVYGSLIGAAVGFGAYCYRNRLAALPLADLIAPSMALGLCIGRLGCLLNGCCFGGTCDHAWAVTFPADSPPYLDQKGWGELHGLRLERDRHEPVVAEVLPGSRFDETIVGREIVAINGEPAVDIDVARYRLERTDARLSLEFRDGTRAESTLTALPRRSRPVHPTQIYSSLNAAFLCGVTLLIAPFRRRHGQVIATLLTLYAVTRFLLEMIRTDELGFIAQLTISQNVSLAIGACMIALWVYVQTRPTIAAEKPAMG